MFIDRGIMTLRLGLSMGLDLCGIFYPLHCCGEGRALIIFSAKPNKMCANTRMKLRPILGFVVLNLRTILVLSLDFLRFYNDKSQSTWTI